MRTVSRCSPNTRAASRVLIPSTMQARRTRAYNSTLYILYTFHRVALNSMEGSGWYGFTAPHLYAITRLAGTLLLRPLQVVRRVFDRIRSRERSRVIDLTPREKEILASFSQGMSYTAIAEAREVKVVTIRNAIYTIQVKLGLDTKQEIVVWAVRNGLLDD